MGPRIPTQLLGNQCRDRKSRHHVSRIPDAAFQWRQGRGDTHQCAGPLGYRISSGPPARLGPTHRCGRTRGTEDRLQLVGARLGNKLGKTDFENHKGFDDYHPATLTKERVSMPTAIGRVHKEELTKDEPSQLRQVAASILKLSNLKVAEIWVCKNLLVAFFNFMAKLFLPDGQVKASVGAAWFGYAIRLRFCTPVFP